MPAQALTENAVEIPILRMDQKPPDAASTVGRIKRLFDGVVDKYKSDTGDWLRINDRPGFVGMAKAIGDPYNGGHVSIAGVPSPSCTGKLGDQLFMIGSDASPYVYSPASVAWEKFSNDTVLTNRMSTSPVYSSATRTQCPDAATIGNIHCYVWQQGATGMCMILDNDGTAIRAPFVAVNSASRIKVAADPNFFYVFFDGGGAGITVVAFTPQGVADATATATTLFAAGDTWDVTYQADVATVALCRRGSTSVPGAGLTIVTVVDVAHAISIGSNSNPGVPWTDGSGSVDPGGAFVLNTTGDGSLYVALIVNGDGYTLEVVKVNLSVTVAHTYQPIESGTTPFGITNISGFVSGTTVYAMVSHLPYTTVMPAEGYALNAFTEYGHATLSADALGQFTERSVQLASRVFFVGIIPVAYMYYASVPSAASFGTVTIGQPTFFIGRADTGACVGRIFHGSAAMDWTWNAWDGTSMQVPNAFQLPTPRTKLDGSIAVSLGQTGTQQVVETQVSGGPATIDNFVSTVGVIDLVLGKPGLCVELNQETLVPGPLPRSFDGLSFSASGIELDPETPSVADSGSSGFFNPGEVYSYAIVWARRDRTGRVVRSGSISQQYTAAGSAPHAATVTIPTLRFTSHNDLIAEVYRTVWVNGQQGTTHHKVSNDLAPLKNDPTADTITFLDQSDNAGLGEILYGGSGAIPASLGGGDGQEVDHDPPPPFSAGCVFNDICFLLGFDNTVWFSLPGTTAQPYCFGEGLFQMSVATPDTLVGLEAMDGRLIVRASQSFWFTNQDSFLDSTGAGDIPTPQRLPITHGSTGAAGMTPAGDIYASSAGGFYLLGRDLTSSYIGEAVEDEMVGATVLFAVSDQNQRVYFLTSNNTLLIYDITFGGWWVWGIPSVAILLGLWRGNVLYADGSANVCIATPGAVADNVSGTPTAKSKTVTFAPMGFADSSMVWELDLFCLGGSGYSMNASVAYDLDSATLEVFPPAAASANVVDASGRVRFNLLPSQPECSYIQLTLSDSFPGGPAAGFQLEKIVAAVGVIPGKRRGSIAKRISP